jgi:biopolymer transport protein ExbB/TolQ
MGTDYQIILEVIVTIVIIGIQFIFYFQTGRKITFLENIFHPDELKESNIGTVFNGKENVEIIILENDKHNIEFIKIVDSINAYLIQNKGAADFAIIKNIVDRNLESKEEEISSNISLPLYIGLMGTFLGILFGLVKIAFFGGVTTENIESFIGGVFIAMIASLIGLLLTVLNNSGNYKKAKKNTDRKKNAFFDFLQIHLLPHLGNSIYDIFDRFKNNISDFNIVFSKNISLFDTKFSTNISDLKSAIGDLSENIVPVIDNIETQKEFIKELKGKGYDKIVKANLEIFTLMERVVPTFWEFIERQKELNDSLEKTSGIVGSIESVMNRVKKFEESINNLGERIETADYMGSDLLNKINHKLDELDRQFELLKQHSQYSKGEIEHHFEQSVLLIKNLSANILVELREAMNFNIEENPLLKLHVLDNIDAKLKTIADEPNSHKEIKQIATDLNTTKDHIHDLKESIIPSIQENKTDNKKRKAKKKNDLTTSNGTERKSLWKRLNPFK